MIGRIEADPHGAAAIASGAGFGPGLGLQRMVGQVAGQVLAHADRPDARTATAVRDAERLVQIQVRHVRAELARTGQPHHRVEVGAVDIDLAARVVHERAHLADVLLEDPVRGRVGDHDRGEVVAVLLDLGLEVVQVDLALVTGGLHDDDPQPGHDRRRGVRAVRGAGIRHTSRCSPPLARW